MGLRIALSRRRRGARAPGLHDDRARDDRRAAEPRRLCGRDARAGRAQGRPYPRQGAFPGEPLRACRVLRPAQALPPRRPGLCAGLEDHRSDRGVPEQSRLLLSPARRHAAREPGSFRGARARPGERAHSQQRQDARRPRARLGLRRLALRHHQRPEMLVARGRRVRAGDAEMARLAHQKVAVVPGRGLPLGDRAVERG